MLSCFTLMRASCEKIIECAPYTSFLVGKCTEIEGPAPQNIAFFTTFQKGVYSQRARVTNTPLAHKVVPFLSTRIPYPSNHFAAGSSKRKVYIRHESRSRRRQPTANSSLLLQSFLSPKGPYPIRIAPNSPFHSQN